MKNLLLFVPLMSLIILSPIEAEAVSWDFNLWECLFSDCNDPFVGAVTDNPVTQKTAEEIGRDLEAFIDQVRWTPLSRPK